jgi:hypothetical protein
MTKFLVWIFALLITGLIFWGADSSQSVQNCVASSYDQNHNQPIKQDAPAFSVVFGWHKDCLGAFVRKNDAAITAVATILLTFVTAGLVWIGIGQTNTSRAQLRAYVFVESAQVVNVIEGNGSPESHVVIKNYGQTPAYELVSVSGIAMDEYPPPPTLNLTVTEREFGTDGETMGPSDTSFSIIPSNAAPVPPDIRAAIISGNWVVYVYGEIRYKDVFGRRQWTKYRMMMGGPAGVRGGQLIACDQGNKAT